MTPPRASSAALRPRPTREPGQERRRRAPTAPARRPRRVSGPARQGDRARRSQRGTGAALIVIGLLEGLAPRALLDRLSLRRSRARAGAAVFSRAWIAIVAFALIGIVTLQLGLLKLNAGIGRALEHAALLQRENAALSVENSEMAASDRVQTRAAGLGMEAVAPVAVRFLTASPLSDAARSAAALSAPPTGTPTSSAEAQSGSPAAAAPSASAPTGEAPGGTPSSAGQAPATPGAAAPASGEHPGTPAGEARPQSSESTTASAPISPSSTAPAAPAGGGAAEASPAGGTQSGASG